MKAKARNECIAFSGGEDLFELPIDAKTIEYRMVFLRCSTNISYKENYSYFLYFKKKACNAAIRSFPFYDTTFKISALQ